MITLLVWCVMNGFIFHFDPNIIVEDTKMIIAVICVASDMNLIATFSRK